MEFRTWYNGSLAVIVGLLCIFLVFPLIRDTKSFRRSLDNQIHIETEEGLVADVHLKVGQFIRTATWHYEDDYLDLFNYESIQDIIENHGWEKGQYTVWIDSNFEKAAVTLITIEIELVSHFNSDELYFIKGYYIVDKEISAETVSCKCVV